MKVAVFGCGSIGRRHIGNLIKQGCDVVAWNRSAARAESAAQDFGIRTYTDRHALLKEEKPEIVFICTPNSAHTDDAIEVAEYGAHLFIEKPVAHTLEGLEKLQKLVDEKQLLVQIGSNMRYDFGPSTLYRYVQEGKIGRVTWGHFYGGMYLPDWHPEEDYRQMYSAKKALGGGVVLDFIHEIDLILWFFGECEHIVGRAYRSGMLEIETDDVADMVFLYDDKNINLHIDYLQKPFTRGIKLVGDKGWCEWSLSEQKVRLFDLGTSQLTEIDYPQGYEKNDMYMKQLELFLTCVKEKKDTESNLRAGINALNAALSIE